jgi:fatty acid synthase subunit alpha, fungi type
VGTSIARGGDRVAGRARRPMLCYGPVLFQVLMTARLALAIGCPIYAIVAHTATATDQAGRSVPAPGQGVLTTAREVARAAGAPLSRVLDSGYRRRRLAQDLASASAWALVEEDAIGAELAAAAAAAIAAAPSNPTEPSGSAVAAVEAARRIAEVVQEKAHLERTARRTWCVDFAGSAAAGSIAPLRAALATWGLGPDDITIGSFHGAL